MNYDHDDSDLDFDRHCEFPDPELEPPIAAESWLLDDFGDLLGNGEPFDC